MKLGDVLHVLKDEGAFSTNVSLYILLFTDDTMTNASSYEDIAKKLFSTRGLKGDRQDYYCEEPNFNHFCDRINTKYLTRVHNKLSLYDKLKSLVVCCSYLPEEHKDRLIATCNPNVPYQLARFIAACVILGSYHTLLSETTEYNLSLDFMHLENPLTDFPMLQKIWQAEQRSFLDSRAYGSRFFELNIIERLLPQGYVTEDNFQLRARTVDGEVRPLMDLCKENEMQDIAVTGEGGIGKTTFLQQILQEEYLVDKDKPSTYKSGRPVPIFIELKQCPAHIADWYEDKHKKTNFITRYVGQLIENHQSLDDVSEELLKEIEKEFQRIPDNGIPQYLLLLDGFNEISVEKNGDSCSCRAMLSNEITTIHNNYRNVRIIATSRETQAAHFTSSFQNIYLVGLEETEIIEHLKERNFSETAIGITLANKSLMKCLKVPLFLCMFSYEYTTGKENLPETRGEILYYFFHGNSTFYNARMRAKDTQTNPLEELHTALTLDFILPYIGWTLERNDSFSMSENSLKSCINEALQILQYMFVPSGVAPYEDFQFNAELFAEKCNSLVSLDNAPSKIIGCAFDYLGILYHYLAPEKEMNERNQFSFVHHYFRDYFSAMFDIQLLRMLPYTNPDSFAKNSSGNAKYTYHYFLNSFYWNHSKKELISQILMEHHNKPVLNKRTQNWILPNPATDEQKVLSKAIDFCRALKGHQPSHHLLHNILSAIVYGRQELSGMDLSNLDFSHCNIFSVPCSKKGCKKTLAANFDNSILPDDFLEPDDHVSNIEEYVYSGQHCFTLDMSGVIKCWDILSGCIEFILQSGDPNGFTDYSPNGYMKVSKDGRWLAAKAYNNTEINGLPKSCLFVFDLHNPEQKPHILKTPASHTTITSFSFTEDNAHILYLADQKYVYCFHIEDTSICYHKEFADFMKHTELYALDDKSDIYAFSGEYDNFDSADFYPEFENEEEYVNETEDAIYDYDDGWDTSYLPIPCVLFRCSPINDSTDTLYSFSGVPGTYPITRYFPSQNCFLLFNEGSGQLELFSCEDNKAEIVFEEITLENDGNTPSAIHYCPDRADECYIIYPKKSYSVSINSNNQQHILMTYDIATLSNLLNDNDELEDLIFYPNITPSWNRFIVRNSENTYEWDTENDTLLHRYNTKLYETRDLIYDKHHQLGILVHQFNGISVFGGEPIRLMNSLCYHDPEYYASGCCYHEATMQLAIMFSKPSHEYVELINLNTGEREIIYSTLQAYDILESIQFHPSGDYLLITLSGFCLEYDCKSKNIYCVAKSSDNELFVDGCYTDTTVPQIQIAIVEHFNYDKPHIEPHCDMYSISHRPNGTSYKKEWRYYMPTLTRESASDFLHYSYDIGSGAAYTKEEYQTYWVTNGFFLHHYPADESFQNIRCCSFNGEREVSLKKDFGKLQMIYCRHDFALSNQYRTEKNCNNYAYCSDNFSEVIKIFDHSDINFWKDLHNNPFSEHYVFDDGEKDSDDMDFAYWDTVIPWDNDTILACYEQYRLMRLHRKGEGQSIDIPYKPCIAINGCSFKNVTAGTELMNELQNNGGNI